MPTIRKRLQNALAGQPVTHPVYVVYDLFNHRWDLDWDMLFGQGLGQINHTNLLEYEFPHLEIKETREEKEGHIHRDVTWITDKGELHELTASLIPDLQTVAQTEAKVAIYIANGHGAWEAAIANTLSPGDEVLTLATGRFAFGWAEIAEN